VQSANRADEPILLRLAVSIKRGNQGRKEKVKMILDTGTLIGITIALAGSCFVMVVGIRAQGKLMQENNRLRKELTELHYNKVKEGI
jgi:hypothetical protein